MCRVHWGHTSNADGKEKRKTKGTGKGASSLGVVGCFSFHDRLLNLLKMERTDSAILSVDARAHQNSRVLSSGNGCSLACLAPSRRSDRFPMRASSSPLATYKLSDGNARPSRDTTPSPARPAPLCAYRSFGHILFSRLLCHRIRRAHLEALGQGVVSRQVRLQPRGLLDLVAERVLGRLSGTAATGAAKGRGVGEAKVRERNVASTSSRKKHIPMGLVVWNMVFSFTRRFVFKRGDLPGSARRARRDHTLWA